MTLHLRTKSSNDLRSLAVLTGFIIRIEMPLTDAPDNMSIGKPGLLMGATQVPVGDQDFDKRVYTQCKDVEGARRFWPLPPDAWQSRSLYCLGAMDVRSHCGCRAGLQVSTGAPVDRTCGDRAGSLAGRRGVSRLESTR